MTLSLVEGCASLSTYGGFGSKQPPQWCVSSQGGETSLRCTGIEHRDFWRRFSLQVLFPLRPQRWSPRSVCVSAGGVGPHRLQDLLWRTCPYGAETWGSLLRDSHHSLLSFDLKWGQCCWKQKSASEKEMLWSRLWLCGCVSKSKMCLTRGMSLTLWLQWWGVALGIWKVCRNEDFPLLHPGGLGPTELINCHK